MELFLNPQGAGSGKGANKDRLALTSHYAELVSDASLCKKIFTAIELEWHRTAAALGMITGDGIATGLRNTG